MKLGRRQFLASAGATALTASMSTPSVWAQGAKEVEVGLLVPLSGLYARFGTSCRQGAEMEGANGLSVRQELQADCFAGVWANHSQQRLQWLQDGDVESALNAASQIGDDTLQREARGTVVPDSFTHGTSAQRVKWFKAGFQGGDINQCNTFAGTP